MSVYIKRDWRWWPIWCRLFGHGDYLGFATEEWIAGRWVTQRRCLRCSKIKLYVERRVIRGARTHLKGER